MKKHWILSAVCGVMFAIPTFLILIFIMPEYALRLAVVAGLAFMLLLFPFLVISEHIMSKKYAKFETTLTAPVLYQTNGNIRLGKKVKNGNLYFCENGVVFASLEEKPHVIHRLLFKDIEKCEFVFIHVNIHMNNGKIYQYQIPDVPQAQETLEEKGWGKQREKTE